MCERKFRVSEIRLRFSNPLLSLQDEIFFVIYSQGLNTPIGKRDTI